TGIGNVFPKQVLQLVALSKKAAQGNAQAREQAEQLDNALHVLSSFDEGADLVLYYKYLATLNGDAAYTHHFNETDRLSPSQVGYARHQYELFSNWYDSWPHKDAAIS